MHRLVRYIKRVSSLFIEHSLSYGMEVLKNFHLTYLLVLSVLAKFKRLFILNLKSFIYTSTTTPNTFIQSTVLI